MRIAICQINPTVADFAFNNERILEGMFKAAEAGCHLALFPELALCGYPPKDWLERRDFVEASMAALESLARRAPAQVWGCVGALKPAEDGQGLYNGVALIKGGKVQHWVLKRLLPTYDVFDEARYFTPGKVGAPLELEGKSFGFTICEDLWNTVDSPLASRRYDIDPVEDVVAGGAEILINIAASPFSLAKLEGRKEMLRAVAKRHGRPLIFVNQVGGNDELLFDGNSAIYDAQGEPLLELAAFEEDFAWFEFSKAREGRVRASAFVMHGKRKRERSKAEDEEGAALAAITMGIGDYARKCGFKGAVLGLSGGIDSALTACLAARALGSDRVLGVALPSRYSSEGSLVDAEALAKALKIHYQVIPIDPLFQAYSAELQPALDAVAKRGSLAPPAGPDVTFENLQARIRCGLLMALSNRSRLLLLTTGNKSEVAVGYCTLYGDMAGGLAPISDVPKTFVYRLARAFNRQAGREIIPESTLIKAPSAELRPDQKDSDSLPPYEVLDAILERFIEQGQSIEEIAAAGFERATIEEVVRLVQNSEYKRAQMPPGLILTRKAFGPGRRYPIAQRWRPA